MICNSQNVEILNNCLESRDRLLVKYFFCTYYICCRCFSFLAPYRPVEPLEKGHFCTVVFAFLATKLFSAVLEKPSLQPGKKIARTLSIRN